SLWFSFFFYFFPDTAPPETYTLSLHDALPISWAALPFWLQVVLYLVISDFLLYWIHRIFHGRRMWKYHAVHHSSEHVDWVSAARFHPVNLFLGTILVDVTLLLAGIPPAVLGILVPFGVFMSAFVH